MLKVNFLMSAHTFGPTRKSESEEDGRLRQADAQEQ